MINEDGININSAIWVSTATYINFVKSLVGPKSLRNCTVVVVVNSFMAKQLQ